MEFDFKNKNFIIKGISVVLILCAWSILIGWRIQNEDVSLRTPLIITVIVSLIGVAGLIFGKNIFGFFQRGLSDDKVPEPMTPEEIEKRIKEEVETKFWNHVKINGGLKVRDTLTVNKNLICAYEVDFLYRENIEGREVRSAVAIINANYRNMPISFKDPKISNDMLKKKMNEKSYNPKEDPDVEETETENILTGTKTKQKKTIQKSKKEEKEKSDVE